MEHLVTLQHEVARLLVIHTVTGDAFHAVAHRLASALDYGWAGIWIKAPAAPALDLVAGSRQREEFAEFEAASWANPVAHGALWEVTQAGSPRHLRDFSLRGDRRASLAIGAGPWGWSGFPIPGPLGATGVLELSWPGSGPPSDTLCRCLHTVACSLSLFHERQLARAALESSEVRCRYLFNNNPSALWVMDRDHSQFLAVNQEALRLYGYSEEEFLRLDGKEFWPGSQGTAESASHSCLSAGCRRAIRHRDKAGGIIEADTVCYTVDWGGQAAHLVQIHDMSSQRRLETERADMESKLRHAQKIESIGQLAAGIAHEINTPCQYVGDNLTFLRDAFADLESLTARQQQLLDAVEQGGPASEVAGSLRRMIRETGLEALREEIPASIDQALGGIRQVSAIVKALKEFSHPGRREKVSTDLRQAISNTLIVSRNEWKYVADLETDFDETLPPVYCLPGEINQVLLNLIINAAQAIQEHNPRGEKGRIAIRTRNLGDWAEIQVADTGGGIPEAIRDRIFDPFFTTKDVGKGSGQGLAIAYSVVHDKHGGTIDFTTEAGAGTTFFVRVPLAVPVVTGQGAPDVERAVC